MSDSNAPAIISGDGESSESPVKFTPCRLPDRVAAEYRFICERFGREGEGWSEQRHFTSLDGQSVWSIELSGGSARRVYFDTDGTIYE